jgi:hypothetical protein
VVRRDRWTAWLALIYTLATVFAQGMHDHGAAGEDRDHDPVVVHGCDDARAGIAGHHTPEPGHPPSDCPACQFRAQIHHWEAPSLLVAGSPARAHVDVNPARALPRRPLRPTGRAPPLA